MNWIYQVELCSEAEINWSIQKGQESIIKEVYVSRAPKNNFIFITV